MTLREQFAFLRSLRRFRRACRVGLAALLGLALVAPSRLAVPPEEPPVLAVAPASQCPIEEGVADLGAEDEMLSAGKLPKDFPEGWRKPPCPKSDSVTKVRGACFLVLAGKPPCTMGYEEGARCLFPIAERKDAARTLGR